MDGDAEDDDDVGHEEEDFSAGDIFGDCEGESYGDAAAEAAPGEDADGAGGEGARLLEQEDGEAHGAEAAEENHGDGDCSGEQVVFSDGEEEDFEADEDEEEGIEDFIEELPEGIEVFDGFCLHGEGAAGVSDEEAGDDHGEWAAGVEDLGELVAPGDEGEGDEDFELVVVYLLEHPEGKATDGEAEEDSACGLDEEEFTDEACTQFAFAGGDGEDGEEDDDADAIIEKGFAGDFRLKRFRGTGFFEKAKDGYGIGGRDEGAEEEAGDEADIERGGEPAKEVVGEGADHEGRDADTDGGECENDAALLSEPGEIDMEGSGKEKVAEHYIQQHGFEIDGAYHGTGSFYHGGRFLAEGDDGQGEE